MRIPELAMFGTWLLATSAQAQELPSPLEAGDLVEVLRAKNPELRARRALVKAAAARPRMVSQLEDPMLSLEWWQQPINFSVVPIMLAIRQPLPWPGKLRTLRELSEREAATARDEVSDAERRLEAEAKRAFLDLALAEASLVISDRQRTLVEAMVQAAEVKYRVGKAAQATMLKAQEELLTVENERLDLERARDTARARLNALLDRDPGATFPQAAFPQARVSLPSEAELMQLALAHRPELKLARDAVAEAQAKIAVARRENNPELAVWAGYTFNVGGVDSFSTGVSTTLPIFSSRKRSAAVEVAEAELQSKQAALDAVARRTQAEVRTALLEMEAARRHERLHADKLIPLSELSLQSAQSAYQNDRIDYFSVLDAARMLRDHHLNHEKYVIEFERRLVDLELAVGQDFSREERR